MRLSLERESVKRFRRIQKKAPALNEMQIIDSALEHFEQNIDKILKKKVIDKVKELKKRGMNAQEIVDYLNKKSIPPLKDYEEWGIDSLSELFSS